VKIVAFELPCRHAAAGMPHDDDVPDYEPLSRDQVTALLDEAARARARGDWRTVAVLQSRLGRALPGITCPRQADGPVAGRGARLNRLLVERYAEGGTPELTASVWAILTEGPADTNEMRGARSVNSDIATSASPKGRR
jgi:hypothetical protein